MKTLSESILLKKLIERTVFKGKDLSEEDAYKDLKYAHKSRVIFDLTGKFLK